ncbi:MAG: hypothetical protein KY463_00505, partial [Actinobacteria bacterium]|nr:hypothetical protein [Actinomycetota bacterium]
PTGGQCNATTTPRRWPARCKAAQPKAGSGAALLTLNGGGVVRRVQQLLDCTTPPQRRARLDVLATTMVLMAIVLAAAIPSATGAAIAMAGQGSTVHLCGQ